MIKPRRGILGILIPDGLLMVCAQPVRDPKALLSHRYESVAVVVVDSGAGTSLISESLLEFSHC